MKKSQAETIYDVAYKVREKLVKKYGADGLSGKSMEASQLIQRDLGVQGYKSSINHGWCLYDTPDLDGSLYTEHYYVSVEVGHENVYLDITATQFQARLNENIPDIIMLPSGSIPCWLKRKEPKTV